MNNPNAMLGIDEADVVVVGSGVAGALVAHQLALAGRQVVMLEAGPRVERWQIVERFRSAANKGDFMAPYPSAAWAPHPMMSPDNHYLIQKGEQVYDAQYLRVVGGTTWHWAAAAWRFLPSDFRLQSEFGVGVDWPIDYSVLAPYYDWAERELGVWGPDDEALGSPRSSAYPMAPLPLSYNEQRVKDRLNQAGFQVVTEPVARNSQPYDNRPTCCGNNNCMPICPIGAMYNGIFHVVKAEKAGVTLIPEAVVHQFDVDAQRVVRAVRYLDPQGQEHRIAAKQVVLAANGIETPKLMQMAVGPNTPNGLGNGTDQVGRYLMDHPGIGVTFLADEPLWPGRGPQEMTSLVSFRDGAFRKEWAAKKIHQSNISRVDGVTRDLLATRPDLRGKALEAEIADRAARYVRLDSFHELLPHAENRIVPSASERDALGLPKPEFHYAIDDYVKRSAKHTRALYDQIAGLMGGSEVAHTDGFANNQHICGTLSMGDDPSRSVVDRDCRVHEHPNLFIASSGVMPTVGSVNCTLTVAALALRLSDLLKKGEYA